MLGKFKYKPHWGGGYREAIVDKPCMYEAFSPRHISIHNSPIEWKLSLSNELIARRMPLHRRRATVPNASGRALADYLLFAIGRGAKRSGSGSGFKKLKIKCLRNVDISDRIEAISPRHIYTSLKNVDISDTFDYSTHPYILHIY